MGERCLDCSGRTNEKASGRGGSTQVELEPRQIGQLGLSRGEYLPKDDTPTSVRKITQFIPLFKNEKSVIYSEGQ